MIRVFQYTPLLFRVAWGILLKFLRLFTVRSGGMCPVPISDAERIFNSGPSTNNQRNWGAGSKKSPGNILSIKGHKTDLRLICSKKIESSARNDPEMPRKMTIMRLYAPRDSRRSLCAPSRLSPPLRRVSFRQKFRQRVQTRRLFLCTNKAMFDGQLDTVPTGE